MTADERSHPRPVGVVAEDGRVALGPLRTDIAGLFHAWVNDPGGRETGGFPDPPRPWTFEQSRALLESACREPAPDRVWLLVYDAVTWRPVGQANIRDIDERHRTAEIGLSVGAAEDRGAGYGTAATRLLMGYAFDVLGLGNLLLDVVEFNPAGVRAYEKAGFRVIGRRRGATWARGRFWDVVLMDAVPGDLAR